MLSQESEKNVQCGGPAPQAWQPPWNDLHNLNTLRRFRCEFNCRSLSHVIHSRGRQCVQNNYCHYDGFLSVLQCQQPTQACPLAGEEKKNNNTSSGWTRALYYIPATIKRNIQSSAAAIFIERERKATRRSWAVGFLCYSDAVFGPRASLRITNPRHSHVT